MVGIERATCVFLVYYVFVYLFIYHVFLCIFILFLQLVIFQKMKGHGETCCYYIDV